MFWLFVISLVLIFVAFSLGIFFSSFFNKRSYDGKVVVEKLENGGIRYSLEIDGDVEELQYQKEIRLKVTPSDKSLIRE